MNRKRGRQSKLSRCGNLKKLKAHLEIKLLEKTNKKTRKENIALTKPDLGENNITIKKKNDCPCPPPPLTRSKSKFNNKKINIITISPTGTDEESSIAQENTSVNSLANEGSCRGNRLLDINDLQCLIEENTTCKHCRSGSIRVNEKTVGIATKFEISCEECKKKRQSITNVPNLTMKESYANQQIRT